MSRNRTKRKPREEIKPQPKEKFLVKAREEVKIAQITAMTPKQELYFEAIRTKDLIVATGYAGTSKTFVACCMAADAYKAGRISRIILARPAMSSSKSLGFTKGDMNEKMMQWVMPMLSVLYMRLGKVVVDLAIMDGNIVLQPLESIKGMSYGRHTWVIADECEDCSIEEIKSIVTRSAGAKMILCGDITQSCLPKNNGLAVLMTLVDKIPRLQDTCAHIDFNEHDDIVRSGLCKELIIAYESLGH
jgi:phosphate starvation-inducible PhoH-like protein